MRFYGFFLNGNEYRYSEKYDAEGNISEQEGSLLAEYRIRKGEGDTIIFNVFLFSLNKQYQDIEITTNYQDTIRPKYFYKAEIYSNMKCFPFKLPVAKDVKDLIFYAKGTVVNTCTQKQESFSDTTSFKDTRL